MAMNRGYRYEEELGAAAMGRTALDYLAQRYHHSDLDTWHERLAKGELTLDGTVLREDRPLAPGQRLAWSRPPWDEPDVPLHFDVIHHADELLVVSKPSGLPTMPAGGFLEHTLLAQVRQLHGADWSPLHRLGRGTSGLVAFARGATRGPLNALFRGREVAKTYLALATGSVTAPRVIDTPIGEREHPLLGFVFAASPRGKPSHSEIVTAWARGDATLVEVRIATGRPHQIRIHLASIGHPLVGDPLYGPGGAPRTDALPGDLGYHLHAWRLAFTDPATQKTLDLEAPPPVKLVPWKSPSS